MNITTRKAKPSGTILEVDGKYAGLAAQSPNHPNVVNPGKWNVSIHTADEGSFAFGPFDTEKQAVEKGKDALAKNLTYAQWCEQEQA